MLYGFVGEAGFGVFAVLLEVLGVEECDFRKARGIIAVQTQCFFVKIVSFDVGGDFGEVFVEGVEGGKGFGVPGEIVVDCVVAAKRGHLLQGLKERKVFAGVFL